MESINFISLTQIADAAIFFYHQKKKKKKRKKRKIQVQKIRDRKKKLDFKEFLKTYWLYFSFSF